MTDSKQHIAALVSMFFGSKLKGSIEQAASFEIILQNAISK